MTTENSQTTEVDALAAVEPDALRRELKRVIEGDWWNMPESCILTIEEIRQIQQKYKTDRVSEAEAFYNYGFYRAMEYMNRSREVPEAFTAEQMEEIHSYFMENIEQPAPGEVREWGKKLHRALNGYLEAFGDNVFNQALHLAVCMTSLPQFSGSEATFSQSGRKPETDSILQNAWQQDCINFESLYDAGGFQALAEHIAKQTENTGH